VKVADGTPAACNFGGVTELPTETTDGEPLVTGDYFLVNTTFIDSEITYTKGHIYEYNGTSWDDSDNGNLVMTLLDDFADISNDVDDTVIGNAVIKKLIALEAVIATLQAQLIEITTGGAIYHGYSSDGVTAPTDGAGFWLGASGVLKGKKAILEEVAISGTGTFEGDITNDLFTVEQGSEGATFTFPTQTRWKVQDAYDKLTNVTAYNITDPTDVSYSMATSVSATYNGSTVVKIGRSYSDGIKSIDAYSGLILYYSSSSYDVLKNTDILDEANHLIVTSPDSFDSDDYIFYSDTSSITTSLEAYPEGVILPLSGDAVYGETSLTIESITPYSTSIKMLLSDSSYVDMSGYMYISGSIIVQTKEDVVETTTLTPKSETVDIGKTTDKFRNGHFSGNMNVDGDVACGTVNATGVITGSKINTGNGDCEVYKESYVDYGTDRTTSATLASFESGEVRYVTIGFQAGYSSASLIAPGNYLTTCFVANLGIVSGGSAIVSGNSDNDANYYLIIRGV
jgi:cytoskeletal protein CcmA (bactofilin family)